MHKFLVVLIVLIAIVLGVLVVALPRDQIIRLIAFRDFFDVSLPILAFGALIKYLCTCPYGHKRCGCSCHAQGATCGTCKDKGCC